MVLRIGLALPDEDDLVFGQSHRDRIGAAANLDGELSMRDFQIKGIRVVAHGPKIDAMTLAVDLGRGVAFDGIAIGAANQAVEPGSQIGAQPLNRVVCLE
jgi:hypothetical protein